MKLAHFYSDNILSNYTIQRRIQGRCEYCYHFSLG